MRGRETMRMRPAALLKAATAAAILGANVALAGAAQAQMSVETGIASGTYGDSFEGWVLVQECIFEDEDPYCILADKGFSYWLSMDNPTPRYVMEAIGALNVNDPVWIRADIVSMGDMSAEIGVLAVRHDPTLDPYADIRAHMQGDWVYAADPSYRSSVSGVHVTEYVNGEFSSEYTMQLADQCETSGGQGPVLIAHIDPWSAPPCMILESVSAEKMIVQLAGGDGSFFKYVRP